MITIVEVTGYIFGFPRGGNVITSSARGISPVAPAKVNSVKFTNASVFNMGTSISTTRISTATVSNLVTDISRIRYSGIKAVKPFATIVSKLVTDVLWVRYSDVKSVPISSTLYLQDASVFNMGTGLSTNRINTAIVSMIISDVLLSRISGIKSAKPFTAIVNNQVTDVLRVKYSGISTPSISSILYLQDATIFTLGTSISTNRIYTIKASTIISDISQLRYSGISANRTGITQTQLIQFWS
jgi:hypothetical protein